MIKNQFEKIDMGELLYDFIKECYPICRSITGNGVRETLNIIEKFIELKKFEIPTGTKCFDWKVPKEWNIKDAFIIDPSGKKILDFHKSNLHVVSYSIPIKQKISFSELKKHIHFLPEKPDSIPYRTSYYEQYWGFCMSYKDFLKLEDGEYDICIDSKLSSGSLTYGEYFIKGELEDEIIFTCYICHPSMCNDNLSGVSIVTFLALILSEYKTKFSYRFLFIPETIGAITWLSINEKNLKKIRCGLVATCCGDKGDFTYKRTRDGNNTIDLIVERILENSKEPYKILDFWPSGSDERQFSSPGINLPIGSLMRSVYAEFSEYHTSKDNLQLIDKNCLNQTLKKYLKIVECFEIDKICFEKNHSLRQKKVYSELDPVFINMFPKCEPELGKRNLYQNIGGNSKHPEIKIAIQWILNFSDGYHSLKDIQKNSKIPYKILIAASELLVNAKLIKNI